MRIIAITLTALVAALHVGFLILEMFYWTEPFGLKTFNQTLDVAKQSAVLAANQGLYNGFLAAGLAYALVTGKADVRYLFLIFVMIAGVYGAATAKPSILFVQALPAFLAALATWRANSA